MNESEQAQTKAERLSHETVYLPVVRAGLLYAFYMRISCRD